MKQIRGYSVTDFLDDAISVLTDIENNAEEMVELEDKDDREKCCKGIIEAIEEIRERMR